MSRRFALCLAFIIINLVFISQTCALENYTLYNNVSSTTVRLIDMNGTTVKTWPCTRTISWTLPYLILPARTMLRSQTVPNPPLPAAAYGGHIQLFAWDGTVLWNYYYSSQNHQQHHDIQPMPNGHVLLQAVERKTRAEGEAMGRLGLTGEMWPEEIVEVDPSTDSIVWEWHLWDHLIQDVDSTKPNYGVVRDHPELMNINFGPVGPYGGDWVHANHIDYDPVLDQIVFSSHQLSEIYVIDHSTTTAEARTHRGGNSNMGGDFLYRWGNPQAYKRGTSSDQHLFVVHGANFIDEGLPGAGHILMFNNGDRPGTTNDYSSAEEIIPPRTGYTYYIHPDSAFGPRQPVWMYSAPGSFYSARISGTFRLSNGNTTICEGLTGRLFEVTPAGQVVWTFQTGGQVANVKRYDISLTGVAEDTRCMIHDTRLRIFPNPTTTRQGLKLLAISHMPYAELQVYDVAGKLVQSLALGHSPLATGQISLQLKAGVYFARVVLQSAGGTSSTVGSETVKFVVAE